MGGNIPLCFSCGRSRCLWQQAHFFPKVAENPDVLPAITGETTGCWFNSASALGEKHCTNASASTARRRNRLAHAGPQRHSRCALHAFGINTMAGQWPPVGTLPILRSHFFANLRIPQQHNSPRFDPRIASAMTGERTRHLANLRSAVQIRPSSSRMMMMTTTRPRPPLGP